MSKSLSLFAEISCYSIKLVRDSIIIYEHKKLTGAQEVAKLLMTIGLHERASEEFYAIYLNTKNEVIGIKMISRGTLNASLVHPREVFKGAFLANANAVILAHNHPSGNIDPSNADKMVTEALVGAGKLLDMQILDHIIIGSLGGFYSFRDSSSLIVA
jgi:DNA repair protein RadC